MERLGASVRPLVGRTAAALVLWALLAAPVFGGPAPDTTQSLPDGAGPPGSAADEPLSHRPRRLELVEGERLVYDIKWSGMPAGTSVLAVKWKRDFEGAEAYHVECETETNTFVSAVYPVKDKIITIIDAEGCFSRLFQMSKSEDRIKQTEHIRFDYESDLAVYEQRRPGAFPTRSRKLVHIDGFTQDPLSCVYYLRTARVAPGETLRMPVHTARRSWPLTVKVVGREELVLPGFGRLSTLRVEPTMHFPGIFVRKGRLVIWIEEETRIVVRMNVDVPIGSVTVTLADAEKAPLVRAEAGAAPGEPGAPAPDAKPAAPESPAGPPEPGKPPADAAKPPEPPRAGDAAR